jgi:hypothetical protein
MSSPAAPGQRGWLGEHHREMATRRARSCGRELTDAASRWRGGWWQRWAAAFRGGVEPPVAGDEVPTVLQLEEGKGNVRRGSSERQRQRRRSSPGGRVSGSAVAKSGRLEGALVNWSG